MKKSFSRILNLSGSRALISLTVILFFGFAGMIMIIGLKHSYWGDEWHFVDTIKYFGNNFHLSALLDYDQVTAPLVFIIFALWGKIFGFEIEILRLLSLIISAATVFFTFHLYSKNLTSKKTALFSLLIIFLNPYFWGLSFFVFTDIPTLFFLILTALAVYYERPGFLFLSSSAALLSRQYSVYLAAAAGLFFLIRYLRGEKSQIKNIAALILSTIPLLTLMLFWGGSAPPSGVDRWIVDDPQVYHFSFITTYITFSAIYLFPLIFLLRKNIFQNRLFIVLTLAFSAWYFFFPVSASYVSLLQTDHDTVGLLHRFIKYGLSYPALISFTLWLFFWIGLIFLSLIIKEDYKLLKEGVWNYGHFLTIAVLLFFLIMPFSYQVWEKYLIIVLPFILLRLMMLMFQNKKILEGKNVE